VRIGPRRLFVLLAVCGCAAALAVSPWAAGAMLSAGSSTKSIRHLPARRNWPVDHVPQLLLAAARALLHASPGRRPRIVGGTSGVQGQWGFMGFVIYYDSSGTAQFMCSGTLVSSNVVLTAGHCGADETTGVPNDPTGYRVVTNAVDWTDTANRVVSSVIQVIVDPNFDPVTLEGDAALLVLSSPVSSPSIPLWGSGTIAAGEGAFVAGWGKTYAGETAFPPENVLQWAPTVVQNVDYCANDAASNYAYDSSTELCAVDYPADDTGTCPGDSGGPLFVNATSGGPLEIGITSVAPTDCNTDTADYFTALEPIDPWIQSEIAVNAPPSTTPTQTTTTPTTTSPATTTSTTPTVAPSKPALPRMTSDEARSDTRQVLAGVLRHAYARRLQLRISCSRTSAVRFNCGITFSSGPNDYYGNVNVFYTTATATTTYWSDRFTVRRVNDHCYFDSGHRSRCKVESKRGTY